MNQQITEQLIHHQSRLRDCKLCPKMNGPVVMGQPVNSRILQIGQAPGTYEGQKGRPFAWTAGKTLFKWYQSIGVEEEAFRKHVYMAAVCRCFPGKNPKGGDRVPDQTEITNCSRWMAEEVAILKPQLIIPVGKLAIAQLMPVQRLNELIGRSHHLTYHDVETDVIPLPHPSGLSTWFKMEPGKTLLQDALALIAKNPAWLETFPDIAPG